jgi:hypothetical protein
MAALPKIIHLIRTEACMRTDNASRGPESLLTVTASPPGKSARSVTLGAAWSRSCPHSASESHRLGALNRARARQSEQAFFAKIC